MGRIIILCEIVKNGYSNEVIVMYDDDSTETIFRYYPDELSFNGYEFIGLTSDEALELFEHKDLLYLRS